MKHLLVVGLSVLLLYALSWASLCELSCSLSHAYAVPQPARDSSTAKARERSASNSRTPQSHSRCGHTTSARACSPADRSFERKSQCNNAPCAQAQTLASPVTGRNGAQTVNVHLSAVPLLPAVTSNIQCGMPANELALTKLLPTSPLSVSLRI